MNDIAKGWIGGAVLVLAMTLFPGVASAHVTVQPTEVPQGSYQVFTVRVPSETEGTVTVSVKVAVPDGIAVSRAEPKPGWKVEWEKRGDGTASSVTWIAEDGKGLTETEFTEFRVQGKVADDAKDLVWKAYETYADGSKAEWVGADGSEHPASVTAVTAAAPGSDGHGHGATGNAGTAANTDAGKAADTDGATADEAAGAGTGNAALWFGIAGCALGLAALIVAIAGRRKA